METEKSDIKEIQEFSTHFEKLIKDTQEDLEQFQAEHAKFKENLFTHLQKMETSELIVPAVINDCNDVSGDLDTTLKQNTHLIAEIVELRAHKRVSEEKIATLEKELELYKTPKTDKEPPESIEDVHLKYNLAIGVLESSIKAQHSEIDTKNDIIKRLSEQNAYFEERIAQMERIIKEKDEIIRDHLAAKETVEKLKQKFEEVKVKLVEQEIEYKELHKMLEQTKQRENVALQKVHEALSVADALEIEKNEAVKRENIVREECSNLAATIGLTMEEAAKKVDIEFDLMRKDFDMKEEEFCKKIQQMKEESMQKSHDIIKLNDLCSKYELRHKEMQNENLMLVECLQKASIAVDTLAAQVGAENTRMAQNKRSDDGTETNDEDNELQNYIRKLKEIEDSYKAAFQRVANKFRVEIRRLKNENATLKAENHFIKIHADDGGGDDGDSENG